MPTSILVVSHNSGLSARIRTALTAAGLADVVLDRAPSAPLALRLLSGVREEFGAIVIDLTDEDLATAFLDELRTARTATPVYGVALDEPSPAAEEAARSSGRRILRNADDLPKILSQETPRLFARKAPRLILFAPAQEGSGASTTALHVAILLSRDHGLRTLFAELDYHSDSIACRLRLPNARSLADLSPTEDWRAAVAKWHDLSVLAAPSSTRIFRGRLTPDFRRVLEDSGRDYDLIVGDLPCNTAAEAPEVLSAAEKIYVVATAEVTSLYLARRRVLELATAGADRNAIRLIINRDRPGAIDSELVRKVTGLDPAYRLPNDYTEASEAETEGRPVDLRGALGQAYAQLSARILGKPASSALPNRWGRLLTAFR